MTIKELILQPLKIDTLKSYLRRQIEDLSRLLPKESTRITLGQWPRSEGPTEYFINNNECLEATYQQLEKEYEETLYYKKVYDISTGLDEDIQSNSLLTHKTFIQLTKEQLLKEI